MSGVPDGTSSANSPPKPTASPPSSAWPWILGFGLLVAVPVIVLSYSSELSRWKLAAAMESWERGDTTAGNQLADEALQIDPTNHLVLLSRAQHLADQRDYEGALAFIDKASQAGAIVPPFVRAEFLTKAGHAKDAVELFDPAIKKLRVAESESVISVLQASYRKSLANLLNLQAYLRAVGNFDLDVAERQIDEALSYVSDRQARTALLDTRGFIRWRKQEFETALADLQTAVTQAEEELKEALGPESDLKRRSLTAVDLRQQKARLMKPLAVIRYHRGLIYQSMDEETKAEQDFARVRELGFEPGDDLF